MIYFDNAASTKPCVEVLDIFYHEALNNYANPSSSHHFALNNFFAIEKARRAILNSLNLDYKIYEVNFLSGATEANNLGIIGFAHAFKNRGRHLITSAIEHSSVLRSFQELEKEGFEVTYLKPNLDGFINLAELEKAIKKDTILISIMGVNNEVGSIFNVEEISKIAREKNIVFHSDVAQGLGKVDFNYNDFDMMTLSGQKIHSLKGIGLLIKKKKIRLENLSFGGNQENKIRSGTQDYPSIMALTKGIELITKNREINYQLVDEISKYMITELSKINEIKLHLYKRMSPYILNISFHTKKASVIVEALSNEGIYVSSMSACSEKEAQESGVLKAFEEDQFAASNAIRISFGIYNTVDEAKKFIEVLKKILINVKGVR